MLLFDTHVFVWLASDQQQLTTRVADAIREHAEELYMSAVTGLELGILVKRGRLWLPLPVDEFILCAMKQHRIQELAVTWRIAHRSSTLPDIHNDPFDRLLIATAQLKGLTLVTKDRVIARYPGVTTLWV
jgi:PIN domain nuclease of toxin-antitoxin system